MSTSTKPRVADDLARDHLPLRRGLLHDVALGDDGEEAHEEEPEDERDGDAQPPGQSTSGESERNQADDLLEEHLAPSLQKSVKYFSIPNVLRMFQPAAGSRASDRPGESLLEPGRRVHDLDLRRLVGPLKDDVQAVRPQAPRASEDAQVLHVEADLLELQVGLRIVRDHQRAHGVVRGWRPRIRWRGAAAWPAPSTAPR